MRRRAGGGAWLGLLLLLAGGPAAATAAPAPDVVVTDAVGDDDEGSLVGVDLGSGRQRLLSSNVRSAVGTGVRLSQPGNPVLGLDGMVYLADRYGVAGRPGILRVNPSSGAMAVVSAGGRLGFPMALAATPGGGLLVSDGGRRPSIIRVDRRSGRQRVFARPVRPAGTPGLRAAPSALAVRRDGAVAAVDRSTVVVLSRDGRRRRVLTSARLATRRGGSAPLTEGRSLLWRPDGHLWVGDKGAVIDVAPDGRQREVAIDRNPYMPGRDYSEPVLGLTASARGTVLGVASHDPLDAPGYPRAFRVFRVDPGRRELVTTVTGRDTPDGPLSGAPAGAVTAPDGRLLVPVYRGGPFRAYGPAVLESLDPALGAERLLTDPAPKGEQAFELPIGVAGDGAGGYVVADAFTDLEGAYVRVDRRGSQRILAPRPGERGVVTDSPRGLFRVGRQLIAVTVNGDSTESRPPRVVAVDLMTGAQTIISTNSLSARIGGSRLLARPGGIVPGPAGHAYVVDSQAFGGGGGIIDVDLRTGRQRELSSNRRSRRAGGVGAFREPVGLERGPGGRVLVADGAARAIMSVSTRTGAARVVTSNRVSRRRGGRRALVYPRDVLMRGRWLVVADRGVTNDFSRADGRLVLVDRRTGRQVRILDNAASRRRGGPALMNEPTGITAADDRGPTSPRR